MEPGCGRSRIPRAEQQPPNGPKMAIPSTFQIAGKSASRTIAKSSQSNSTSSTKCQNITDSAWAALAAKLNQKNILQQYVLVILEPAILLIRERVAYQWGERPRIRQAYF